MDFFDKINAFAQTAADKTVEFAQTAADKTNEMVEDTRLKAQIANDQKSIKELENKIGAHYYRKFVSGEEVDAEVLEYCTAISVHMANIEEKKAALNAKKETETASASDESDPFEQA